MQIKDLKRKNMQLKSTHKLQIDDLQEEIEYQEKKIQNLVSELEKKSVEVTNYNTLKMENKSLYAKLTEKTNVCSKKEKEWMNRAKEFEEIRKERDRLLTLKKDVVKINKERDKVAEDYREEG